MAHDHFDWAEGARTYPSPPARDKAIMASQAYGQCGGGMDLLFQSLQGMHCLQFGITHIGRGETYLRIDWDAVAWINFEARSHARH